MTRRATLDPRVRARPARHPRRARAGRRPGVAAGIAVVAVPRGRPPWRAGASPAVRPRRPGRGRWWSPSSGSRRSSRLPGPTRDRDRADRRRLPPSAPSSLRLELVTDDVLAPSAAILRHPRGPAGRRRLRRLRRRASTEGRFMVDVPGEPSDGRRAILDAAHGAWARSRRSRPASTHHPARDAARSERTVRRPVPRRGRASADLVEALAEPAGGPAAPGRRRRRTGSAEYYGAARRRDLRDRGRRRRGRRRRRSTRRSRTARCRSRLRRRRDDARSTSDWRRSCDSGPLPSPLRLAPEPAGQSIRPGLPTTPAASETNVAHCRQSRRATFTSASSRSRAGRSEDARTTSCSPDRAPRSGLSSTTDDGSLGGSAELPVGTYEVHVSPRTCVSDARPANGPDPAMNRTRQCTATLNLDAGIDLVVVATFTAGRLRGSG